MKYQVNKSYYTLKFSIMQLTFWCVWCSFHSFAGMYFLNKGYTYSFVGICLSMTILAGMFGQIFWGFLCDKTQSIKKIYILANIIIILIILLLALPLNSLQILIAMSFLGFCQLPMVAILDTWIIKNQENIFLNYGFIRMWASVGFAIFGWVLGCYIEGVGFYVMFIFATVFSVVNIVAAALCSDVKYSAPQMALGQMLENYLKLLKNKAFVIFLTACFLIGLGHQAANNLLPLVVSAVGGQSNDLGTVIFFATITEIPLFFFATKIFNSLGYKKSLLLSCSAFIMQFVIIILAKTVVAVTVGMMFQGIAFAIILPTLRSFSDLVAPKELSTSAQTLTDSMNVGLSGAISAFFGGILIEMFGVSTLLIISIFFAIIAVVLFMKSVDSVGEIICKSQN